MEKINLYVTHTKSIFEKNGIVTIKGLTLERDDSDCKPLISRFITTSDDDSTVPDSCLNGISDCVYDPTNKKIELVANCDIDVKEGLSIFIEIS